MNKYTEEELGLSIGDFVRGYIPGYEFEVGEEITEEGPIKEVEFEENSVFVIIEVDESHLWPLLDDGNRDLTTNYKFRFQDIVKAECICGNNKLYSSKSEKWFCPFCKNGSQ